MADLIPKTIHYCWFGGAKLPAIIKLCIKSWKKNCPDYNIVEWNESNFEVADAPIYVRQAYDSKKWAFVSDYVRLFALYTCGGVYMDTDVEVIKPIDRFLKHRVFTGFYDADENLIPAATMGSEARHKWIEMLLNDYECREFIKSDGSYDYTTNVIAITQGTTKHYSIALDDTYQELPDGIVIYPSRYFSPKLVNKGQLVLSEDTHTIHHYTATWVDRKKLAHVRLNQAIGMTFDAYERGEWRAAHQSALRVLMTSPRHMLNKGMWSVLIKSMWRDTLGKGGV
ncbi:MAG: glycosyltransferase family 32 protein [Armatimonadota bacterium]